MKYELQISKNFSNLDEVAGIFGEVIIELHKNREEFNPETARSLTGLHDVLSGEGWAVEVIGDNSKN